MGTTLACSRRADRAPGGDRRPRRSRDRARARAGAGGRPRAVRRRPLRIGALVVLAGVVGGLAAVLTRYPAAWPVALLAAAPFRVLLDVGSQRAFLLVPLYGVLAAAGLALAVRTFRSREVVVVPLLLAVPVAAFIGLAALSALWSLDVDASAVDLLFFYFPFALLVGSPPARRSRRGCRSRWVARSGIAMVLAAVGLWERATRQLVLARDLEVGTRTSLLPHRLAARDPSIYGRFLVVAILVVLVGLWLTRLSLAAGAAVIAFLALGSSSPTRSRAWSLWSSECCPWPPPPAPGAPGRSSSSARSLPCSWRARYWRPWGMTIAPPRDRRPLGSRRELDRHRARAPIGGVGIGAEEQVSEEFGGSRARLAKSSHTAPLTVAAELGIIGSALYFTFLVAAVRLFYLAWLRDRVLASASRPSFCDLRALALLQRLLRGPARLALARPCGRGGRKAACRLKCWTLPGALAYWTARVFRAEEGPHHRVRGRRAGPGRRGGRRLPACDGNARGGLDTELSGVSVMTATEEL